ncbi:imidazoleglycerol-phosphate dehydratase HisB [bacterium]
MKRTARIIRKTTETDINLKLNLDGNGDAVIKTTIAFLDHMLNLFAHHGTIDLEIKAKGDTEIDTHHLTEDMGIVLGMALKKALKDKKGIIRYGFASVPMDDTLVECSVDISGRPYLVYNMLNDKKSPRKEKEQYTLYEHFFYSLAVNAGITIHLNLKYGKNFHHIMEACFKSFARALSASVTKGRRIKGVPSTKGKL